MNGTQLIMKIQIASDIHNEFQRNDEYRLPKVERDLLILAGDIDIGTKADDFILDELANSDVIYVLGNHEFYHQELPAVRNAWRDKTSARINKQASDLGYEGTLHVLDDTSVVINDITFIGATLWTNMNHGNPMTMLTAESGMADYRVIYQLIDRSDWPSIKQALCPEYTMALHQRSLWYFEQELKKPGKKVLISHHLPTFASIDDAYRGNSLNPAYASELTQLFDHDDVMLVVHGHTHSSCDYELYGRRVICNPRGYYPHKLNPSFDDALTVDL